MNLADNPYLRLKDTGMAEGRSPNFIKAALAFFGSVIFLIVSAWIRWTARRYQLSGQPMPNGKGGFMSAGNGYLIALVLVLFSVACFVAGKKFLRSR